MFQDKIKLLNNNKIIDFLCLRLYNYNGDKMNYISYIIIVLILVLIAFVVIKMSKPEFKFEANKLVECLGGIKNITHMEVSVSRFKVTVKDTSLVDKDGIKKLGARGIVEIDNTLKIILDDKAKKLKKYIEDLNR